MKICLQTLIWSIFLAHTERQSKEEHEVKSHSHSSSQAVIMARRKGSFLLNFPLIMRRQAHKNAASAHSMQAASESLLNKLAPSTAFGPAPCWMTVLCWNPAGRHAMTLIKGALFMERRSKDKRNNRIICKNMRIGEGDWIHKQSKNIPDGRLSLIKPEESFEWHSEL